MLKGVLTVLFFFGIVVSASGQKNEERTLIYSLYLLGDAGKVTEGQKAAFKVLHEQMMGSGEKSGIVFLGDNIYQQGLPEPHHEERAHAEKYINSQIDLVKGYAGDYYFIPGNHDWAQGRKFGWSNLLNQEKFVENALDSANVFLPDDGCPGPVEVSLNEQITLIILDTQWFLHRWEKPREGIGSCNTVDPVEVFQQLDHMLYRNRHKRVVVATHHPMYTYGSHGGVFKPSTHLKPPVLGSIYAFYRGLIGSIQDNSHPKYKALRSGLVGLFEKYKNIIHVAGHEHSLQYSYKDSTHYIVSGSGAKTTYVKKKKYAEYAESINGFSKLKFYDDGTVSVQFWKDDGSMAFGKEILKKPYIKPATINQFAKEIDLKDSIVTRASSQYGAGGFKKKMLGSNYRDVWDQEIKVPVFDIGKEHGGLKIVQRGGGMQTKSLRLEASNGKQYVLRSIEKYAEGAVPEMFANTFAVDLVQDQISASHPYGAFVVPPLAEAATIYHTNPKVVLIPDDPHLGEYQQDFANTLALYEERPAGNRSDDDFFGNSKKIVNTTKVLAKLAKDNDNYVDQKWVLKSRLFDLFIGDWDRHDDQWRWASFKSDNTKGKMYRPIPRDRDQAFFINTGFLPSIWSRKWGLPKFEGFDHEVRWAPGLMFNARYFDRSFLSGLSRSDWEVAVKELQSRMTDNVIENAIGQWPKEIFDHHGDEVIAKLKSRRAKLAEYAIEHYEFISKGVDVVGSDKKEHFRVDRLENGDVKVVVRKLNKEGKKKHEIFNRTFKYGETKEVRLYGLGGKDVFKIKGESPKSIKVRVIGGEGKDELDDDSKVRGLGKKTLFYDTKEGNELKLNAESKNKLSNRSEVNSYDRKAFKYNVLMPAVTASFNPDDGVFVGAGFTYTHQGFRKAPYASKHSFVTSFAANTSSYNFRYNGDFTDVIGKWDLGALINVRSPNFTNFYFGQGNESKFDQNIAEKTNVERSIRFYRLRFEEEKYQIGLFKDVGAFGKFGITSNIHNWRLEEFDGKDRFVKTDPELQGSVIENQSFAYAGGSLSFEVDTRKSAFFPTSGILWKNELRTLYGLNNSSGDFHQFNSSFSFYHSFKLPAILTLAGRVGFGKNIGDYPFFYSQTIGGRSNLRGYRVTRFYGEEAFYHNLELRMKLLDIKSYLFPSAFGILAFHDVGRVWIDNEDSDTWHRGLGGGLWFAPFDSAVLSAEIGTSREDTLFYFRFGFLF